MSDFSRQPFPQNAEMSIRTLDPYGASDHRSKKTARVIRSYAVRQGRHLAKIYYYSKIRRHLTNHSTQLIVKMAARRHMGWRIHHIIFQIDFSVDFLRQQ
jgi:hypothetical protein